MKAFVFPGQGAQFVGMGKDLYEQSPAAKELFNRANEVLGFAITDTMFTGTDEALRQTKVTQPAVFLHSVISFLTHHSKPTPDMVAGHSLGELSSLVANGCLAFENALLLVSQRAAAMQMACELQPSTMAAILGLADEQVEEVCKQVTSEIVVPANYNCPGQLVISGSVAGIEQACELMKQAGAKRALVLQVGGAFHSPLMEPARTALAAAIEKTKFNTPICPVFQNVNAQAVTDPSQIQQNLIAQLTAPVRWTQSIKAMWDAGAKEFVECGPGNVLQGLCKKIAPECITSKI